MASTIAAAAGDVWPKWRKRGERDSLIWFVTSKRPWSGQRPGQQLPKRTGTRTLHELSDHILQVHHAYMHEALPRIKELMRKVLNAHGTHHGAMLRQVSDLYNALDTELTNHLRKEEEVLFPYIEPPEPHCQGRPEGTSGMFWIGGQSHPPNGSRTRKCRRGVGTRSRKVTSGYSLPDDACPTFRCFTRNWSEWRKTSTSTSTWRTTSCFRERLLRRRTRTFFPCMFTINEHQYHLDRGAFKPAGRRLIGLLTGPSPTVLADVRSLPWLETSASVRSGKP